ncbi:MAG: sulfotransferase family protein [Chloroflexota bacterium]|nr:sulfotransferase family protein [Chloroflexota bacterium]
MSLRVVGAGLPRTATSSLQAALEYLLGGRCYHMSAIPGHPFNLGVDWNRALAGGTPDWARVMHGYVASVDWPASMFWRELSAANHGALVLLSVRESAESFWRSADESILPYARTPLAPSPGEGNGFLALLECFTGTERWDDPATMMAAYERHNAAVREGVEPHRLLEWRPADGWASICRALGAPVPDLPFPRLNARSERVA